MRGFVGLQRLAADVLVGVVEAGLGEAHALGEQPEHFDIRLRLAHRRDRRIVREHVEVPVGLVDVGVLELRRRRQHDVRVVAGVGEEEIVHDGEQVGPREAGYDLVRVGAHRHRVVVVDEDRLDRRVCRQQRITQRRLVDGARLAAG